MCKSIANALLIFCYVTPIVGYIYMVFSRMNMGVRLFYGPVRFLILVGFVQFVDIVQF